jgi:hypothetical protein
LEKAACGAFSDRAFVAVGKRRDFCRLCRATSDRAFVAAGKRRDFCRLRRDRPLRKSVIVDAHEAVAKHERLRERVDLAV